MMKNSNSGDNFHRINPFVQHSGKYPEQGILYPQKRGLISICLQAILCAVQCHRLGVTNISLCGLYQDYCVSAAYLVLSGSPQASSLTKNFTTQDLYAILQASPPGSRYKEITQQELDTVRTHKLSVQEIHSATKPLSFFT